MVNFVWDERKSMSNLRKHGVDFNDAARAWHDPDRLDFFGENHSTELRRTFLGAVAGLVLLMVEAKTEKNDLRITSARRALKHEQELYHANRKKNS